MWVQAFTPERAASSATSRWHGNIDGVKVIEMQQDACQQPALDCERNIARAKVTAST